MVCVLTACDPGVEVRIEPDSRADSLVFRIFSTLDTTRADGGLNELVVESCGGATDTATKWKIARTDGPMPNTAHYVQYGRVPDPYWRVVRQPVRLADGCYTVTAFGTGLLGYTNFIVDRARVSASGAR
jgi:hypothetical protein